MCPTFPSSHQPPTPQMSTLVALAIILLFSGFAASQVSYPTCTDASLDWSFNSVGQNPCQVAAYLQSTCWQGSFAVPPLAPGYEYTGPSGNGDADLCKCNTVTYSLLSACDACQGELWVSWSEWVANCSNTEPPSNFPNPVPIGIYVPYWSTLDVTLENNWNLQSSMAAGDSPEIGPGQLIGGSAPSTTPIGTPTQSPPATGFPATTTPTSMSNSPGLTPSSIPSSSPTSAASLSRGSSSKTGPIVGGAVAGVAVIGVVILVIVYLRRRQLSNSPYGVPSVNVPPAAPLAYQGDLQTPNEPRRAMSEEGTVASSSPPHSPVNSGSMRVYDPSDPTTFPDMSAVQYAPNIAPQVIFGGSKSTVATQPSVPQYHGLPTGPARPMPLDSQWVPHTSKN